MKKHSVLTAIVALMLPLCFMACSETEETNTEFSDWQNRNENYFASIYERATGVTDGSMKIIRNYTLEDTIAIDHHDCIVVEVLEEGTGSGCPMYSDSVLVNYRGRLIPSASYPEGYVFDESYTGEYNPNTAMPSKFYVGDLIDGFSTAMQNMHIGDHWRVYIPHQLGYGSSSSDGIPSYSTLIYDVELVAYYRVGTPTDPWYAKGRLAGSAYGVWITE